MSAVQLLFNAHVRDFKQLQMAEIDLIDVLNDIIIFKRSAVERKAVLIGNHIMRQWQHCPLRPHLKQLATVYECYK